jgi:hypothetical protein
MSVFQNVSGVDRELVVDGRRVEVAAGDLVTVADEFDCQLVDQAETWKFSKKKSAAAESTPAVPDSTEPVAATEGDN